MSAPAINDGVIRLTCTHSNHLFDNPLCKKQTLLQRIANVAFHILTLGIPLIVYQIYSCCFRRAASNLENGRLQKTAIDSVQQNKVIQENPPVQTPVPVTPVLETPVQKKPPQENTSVQKDTVIQDPSSVPYSTLGQEAFAFARKKLAEHPEITPYDFQTYYNRYPPINPEIVLLATLRKNACENFDELMKKNLDNPWSNQEVINAADECMKLSFAISNLTLEDVKPFADKHDKSKDGKVNYAKMLVEQSYYLFKSFYYCTSIYHIIRAAKKWDLKLKGLKAPKIIPDDHANLFYKTGTIQNSWNILYNEYCGRIRLYVTEKELRKADSRPANWTIKDTGVETFCENPWFLGA